VDEVAAAFAELLAAGTGEFAGAFKLVLFAVPKRFGTANFEAFARLFPELAPSQIKLP